MSVHGPVFRAGKVILSCTGRLTNRPQHKLTARSGSLSNQQMWIGRACPSLQAPRLMGSYRDAFHECFPKLRFRDDNMNSPEPPHSKVEDLHSRLAEAFRTFPRIDNDRPNDTNEFSRFQKGLAFEFVS